MSIIGSKGGGKGGGGNSARVPVEAKDSLRSKAFAKVIDLVSEGEISGLVDGLKSVYLDGTPIQNPDGSYNFSGAELTTRSGSQQQSHIPGFSAAENTIEVGVEVTTAISVTRQITNSSTNTVRVIIGIPNLSQQNTTNGDLNGTTVEYAIDLQSNGGGFVPQLIGYTEVTTGLTNVSAARYASTDANTKAVKIVVPAAIITGGGHRMEYKLVASGTWLTEGVTTVVGGKIPGVVLSSASFKTPTLVAGQWEARVVTTGGAAISATGVSATRFAGKENETVTGKTTTRYQRSHEIKLTGSAPWDIRVRRITADSTSVALQNKTYFDTLTEVIEAKLRYPNSALVGLKIDSSQFQNIPTRGYEVNLLMVQVPSNYEPTTRVYTGTWDGTFKVRWTNNPAWCFYDLLTNERYGLGALIDVTQVDKWSLYTIGQYCDALVDNGFGGTEPRFTCNFYLQTRAEAYKVLQDFASIFRGMAFWSTGAITAVQDAPSDPVALFTAANVIDGKFTYAGSGLKARHTVALVTWNDPDDLYRQKVEYVEDTDGIARYGAQQTEITAVGCTSRGQANRVGKWLLFSERLETETIQFSVGLDGALVRPGSVIKVSDANRAAARLGGRVSASTTTTVTVDRAPTVSVAGWTIYGTLADGTVESRTILTAVGTLLTVSVAFTSAPTPQGIWILSGPSVEAQTFRVLAIAEDAESKNYAITALVHEPLKYAAIEQGLILQPRDITLLSAVPAAPTTAALTEYLYSTLTDVRVGVDIAWPQVDGAASYAVSYRVNSGNYVETATGANTFSIKDAAPGTYNVQIRSVSAIGVKSVPYSLTASVLGKTARPADVTGLQMTVQGGTGVLQWTDHPDLDVRIGGQIAVRYSESLEGAQWNTSLPVADFPGAATSGIVPLSSGTYLAKAKDSTSNYSTNATLVVTNAPNILQYNAVASSQQDPLFPGVKTDLVLVNDKLQLEQTTLWDSITDLDAYPSNLDGGLVESGEYEFDNYIDTGAVYTSRVSARFSVVSFSVTNLVDDWPMVDTLGLVDEGIPAGEYVDLWADWDEIVNFDFPTLADEATLQMFISTTNDDPATSPAWSDWRLFYVGDYTARGFKFKVRLVRGENVDNQVALPILGVTVDVPDRVESANNIAVPAAGLVVTYANAFFVTPAVAITAENLATGDYAEITAKTQAGFTIRFKNTAGTGVARTVDWIAKGFGYQN